MPSTATTRNRFEKQAAGENSNTWGAKVNTVFDMLDACLDGVVDIVTAGATTTLTNVDYTADQAKNRVLNCTGTGGTVVIPNAEKAYLVRNAATGDVIISTGSGTTATVPAGFTLWVFSTGSNAVYTQTVPVSGTYTPTIANLSNVGASALYELQYDRNGNNVAVFGKFDITRSGASGSLVTFDLSLPIASAFVGDGQAAGIAIRSDGNYTDTFSIVSNANGKLRFSGRPSPSTSATYSFNAKYRIV